ncbi:protein toll isoform X2 [Anopheles gambiae]|nr:protein toll isoform X2 [Anopheles gambiae]
MGSVWVCCLSLLVLLTAQVSGNDCTVEKHSDLVSKAKCPGFNVQLTLHTNPRQLEVTCSDKPDFQLLKNIQNLPNFKFEELAYQNCPLPVGNQSLVDLLSAFLDRTQLSSIRRLFFVDNAKLSGQVTLDPQLFADLPALQVLSMKNSSRMPLDNPELFKYLQSLTWIDLREGDGGSRNSKVLLHTLTQLTTLELTENELTTLPTELITDLPSLGSLTLYHNKLERIEQFADLPNLTSLDLTYNELDTLQEDVFYKLPNLTHLFLNSNKLTSLPSGLLKRNTKLIVFRADNQHGSGLVLGDELFAGLTMLEDVSVSNCKLTTLPEGLFTAASKLTKLDVSDNKLQSLPENLLRHSSILKELYLQHNELINMLPDTLLQSTNKLRILNLGHNKLTTLSKYLLDSKNSLEELHLEYNQLYMIDRDAFISQAQSLKMLNLSHNQVALHVNGTDVFYLDGKTYYISQTPFYILAQLTDLDLSYNAIIKIFGDFKGFMGNLQSLDLSHNLIMNISDKDFSFLSPKIEKVNLESNRITMFTFNDSKKSTFSNRSINTPRQILLADNSLNCDCISSSLVTYLQDQLNAGKFVPLKGLHCAQPPELLGRKPQDLSLEDLLCKIDVSSGFCPTECKCYKRAVDQGAIVNCTAANLTRVPVIKSPSIVGRNMIELYLEQNMIKELSNVGEGWNTIRRLNIANNSFTTLPGDSLPEQLELLDVSGNQLTEVDAAFIIKLNHTALRNISLSANPWDCHCENPLLAFAVDNAARITGYSTLQCSDGQPINSATLNDLCAWPTTLKFYISAAVSLVLAACLLAIWLYMKYSLEIKVWLFKHNLLQWLVTEEQIDMDKRYDAFISYSHKDEEFVTDQLLPRLESEELNFKICWHVRDFMPGEMIATQITKAVEDSRRTIIILSLNYLESVWGQMEFNTAYLQSLEDKRNRVIPIIYQDIGDIDQLDPELRAYLKTNTYVRWDDPWFWDKLHYAMPHKRRPKGVQATDNMRMASVDKLNLLKAPAIMTPASSETTPPVEHAEKGIAHDGPLGCYGDPSKTSTMPPFIISNGMSN